MLEGFINESFDNARFKAPYWPNNSTVDPLLEFINEPFRFSFIYFGETDDIAHAEGISKEYKESIKIYLKRIAQLKSYLSPNDYLCIISDHGRDDFNGCCGSIACITGKTHRAFFRSSTKNVPLLFFGPGINASANIDGCYHADVAPTLLSFLGIPKATTMNGKVLNVKTA